MSSLKFVILLSTISAAACLSDLYQTCLQENKEPLPSDFLLGTWYEIYKFTIFSGPMPSSSCVSINFTRPTTDEMELFKKTYDSPGLPYSFDDDPVMRRRERLTGMTMGNSMAKFLVLSPDSLFTLPDGYSLFAYKPLNDNFIMFSDCSLRGNLRWLLARNRDATEEEMTEVITNTRELRWMEKQRFCAKLV